MPTYAKFKKGFYKECVKTHYVGVGVEVLYCEDFKELDLSIRLFKRIFRIGYRFKSRIQYYETSNLVFTDMEAD